MDENYKHDLRNPQVFVRFRNLKIKYLFFGSKLLKTKHLPNLEHNVNSKSFVTQSIRLMKSLNAI